MQSRRYSSEDVQKILAEGQALINQSSMTDKHFSEEDLREMAHELTIDEGHLEQAITTWQAEKSHEQQQRRSRKLFYQQHLLPYASVNTFLVLLNIYLAGAITWAIYPVLGWGLGLFLGPLQRMFRQSVPTAESFEVGD